MKLLYRNKTKYLGKENPYLTQLGDSMWKLKKKIYHFFFWILDLNSKKHPKIIRGGKTNWPFRVVLTEVMTRLLRKKIKHNIEIIIIIMIFYSFLKKSDLHCPLIGLQMHTWLLGQMRGVRKQKNVEQPWWPKKWKTL